MRRGRRHVSWPARVGGGVVLGFVGLGLLGVDGLRAQQAQSLNGPPQQVIPYAAEPGAPMIQIPVGQPSQNQGSSTGTGGGVTGDSSALSLMLSTPWGVQAVANAESLGLNPSALAATCQLESGCTQPSGGGGGGGAQGIFQMYPAAFQEGLQAALAANAGLASQIVPGQAGMLDPTTEAIAASGYLLQANQALQSAGIANPTVLDVRAYYNFGPQGGLSIANAPSNEPMAQALPMYTRSQLAANGVTPGMTVGQWRSSVAAKIGNAAGQTVLT